MTTRDVPYDVTTIGETLLRISVGAGVALETADTAALHAGGAESNFACALAQLGRHVAWASRLPEQPLGRFIANALRQSGVDLALVEWCPAGRVGTYYVELRLPPTPVRVIYDRAGSCAAMMQPGDIPVERLLNSRLLHLTGITPALSGSCHQSMIRLADEARRRSVPFSFDINYRRKLWTPSAARDALLPLARGAEILFVAQSDAADVFGLPGSPDQTVASLRDLFQAKHVVLSIGEGGIVVWDGKKILRQSAQPTAVIDRLGAGDALAAGVIHGWLAGDFEAGLQYGLALAALSLRSQGDSVVVHPDELAEMVAGGSTRPLR